VELRTEELARPLGLCPVTDTTPGTPPAEHAEANVKLGCAGKATIDDLLWHDRRNRFVDPDVIIIHRCSQARQKFRRDHHPKCGRVGPLGLEVSVTEHIDRGGRAGLGIAAEGILQRPALQEAGGKQLVQIWRGDVARTGGAKSQRRDRSCQPPGRCRQTIRKGYVSVAVNLPIPAGWWCQSCANRSPPGILRSLKLAV
jgi:hypothetical protein